MPQIGEIKNAQEIGYRGKYRYIYSQCVKCGSARWVELKNGKPRFRLCPRCSKLCMFCGKAVGSRYALKVTIYDPYETKHGLAHRQCFTEYLNEIEFRHFKPLSENAEEQRLEPQGHSDF